MTDLPKPSPAPKCEHDWKEKMANNLINGIEKIKQKHCKPAPVEPSDTYIANGVDKQVRFVSEFKERLKPMQEVDPSVEEAEKKYKLHCDMFSPSVAHLESQLNKALDEKNYCAEEVSILKDKLATANAKIVELESNLDKTVCVWCGHIGKKNALELLNHVKECSKHPMKKAFDKLAELPKIQKLIGALNEINEMFDGEADIDNNGHSNRAMKICVIIDEALTGVGQCKNEEDQIRELEGDLAAVRANKEVYEKKCAEYIDRIVELENKHKGDDACSDWCISEVKRKELESLLSTANTKAEKLVEALEPFMVRLEGWRKMLEDKTIVEPISAEWLAVEQAIKEFRS